MSDQNNGQFAIVELMGRKVVAGYVTEEVVYGKAMLRVDVPATSAFPPFTQYYGAEALYCVTPVSEDVAKLTAEANRVNPVSVYVPNLITREQVEGTIERYKREIESLKRGLPEPEIDEE